MRPSPPPASGALRLTLFGGPRLERDGQPVALTPLQDVLVGLLAVHGRRGVGRDRLLGLLWTEGTDEQLRRRLNQLVYSIQRRTGERLVRLEGSRYVFTGSEGSSDLAVFLTALQERDPARAVEVVLHGFMARIERPPTPELDQWIRERDLRFRADVRTLAAECWSEAEQRGDWSMAEGAATALLRLDPFDEASLRRLLHAQALLGRAREAEAAYRGFRDLASSQDPEWEPDPRTRTLLDGLESLAREREAGTPAVVGASRKEVPFVGRRRVLDELVERVVGATDQGFHTLVVRGEPGIGKTRLVREALARAPFHGVRVLRGRGSEFERGVPLSPLLQALSQDWTGREIQALASPWRELLLGLLPEFASEGAPAAPGAAFSTEEIPRATCEAFLRLFARLANPDPVVLFLDDFHWLDATSLTVLEYVHERWQEGGLLLLAAVRPEELSESPSVGRWLGRRPAGPGTRAEIALGPLRESEVEALLRAAWIADDEVGDVGGPEEGHAVERLAGLLGGHPLLAIEYARNCREALQASYGTPEAKVVSEAVQDLVRRRTSRLTPEARRLLRTLAPSEKPLPHSVVERAFGASGGALAAALDEAIDHDLLAISPRGIEYRHLLLREAVYEELSAGERLSAHRIVAESLVAGEVPGTDLDVALHLLTAGEGRRATPHVLRAARSAIEAGGWVEARVLLERALQGIDQAADRLALASLLGTLLNAQGAFTRSGELWRGIEAELRLEGASGEADQAALRGIEAAFLDPRSDRETLLHRTRGLRDGAMARGDRELVAECMRLEVALLDRMRRVQEVRDLSATAARVSPIAGRDARLAYLLVSMVDAVYGDPEGAAEMAGEAMAIARDRGDPETFLRALNWKVIAWYHLARLNLPEGMELLRMGADAASASTEVDQRYLFHANVGVWYLDVGALEMAEEAFERAEGVLKGLGAPQHRRLLLANLGQLALENGSAQEAQELYKESLAIRDVSPWEPHRCTALAGLALAQWHDGGLQRALETRAQLPTFPEHWTFDPTLWLTAEARLDLATGALPPAVLARLRAQRALIQSTIRTAWIRLGLLMLEIGGRTGPVLEVEELGELEDFLVSQRIPERHSEYLRLTRRAGLQRPPAV